jgi:hypothetical protein
MNPWIPIHWWYNYVAVIFDSKNRRAWLECPAGFGRALFCVFNGVFNEFVFY